MTEMYAKRETHSSRGEEGNEGVRLDADSGENARRISTGTGTECFQFDREGRKEGNLLGYAVGGMLDQLIEDARKQLGKSRECIVWYREEEKECEQKLNNFLRLKELHEQQMAAEAEKAAAAESSNQNGGENLAE